MSARRISSIATLAAALLVAGCGSSTASPPQTARPSASGAASVQTPLATPAPTATPAPPTPSPTLGHETCATDAAGVCIVHWFVGLGSGVTSSEVAADRAVAAAFNASPTAKSLKVKLELEVHASDTARATLANEIAANRAPDIVGPVGVGDLNGFRPVLADLDPLMRKSGYDRSAISPAALRILEGPDPAFPATRQAVFGLPFAVYPSVLFYNEDLFREANAPAPPHKVGQTYTGKPWDLAALQSLAGKLTIDRAGRDATQAGFDPATTVQWGFDMPGADARGQAGLFGGGTLVGPGGGVQITDASRMAWHWWFDAIWRYHFVPSYEAARAAELGRGNEFASGHLAVALLPASNLATVASGGSKVTHWNLAVPPSYGGTSTAGAAVATFAMIDGTARPETTFAVMRFLAGSQDLLTAYGGVPARKSDQPAYVARLTKTWPGRKVDWQVLLDSANRAGPVTADADMPNYDRAEAAIRAFTKLYQSNATIDIDAEIDRLASQLGAIFAGS